MKKISIIGFCLYLFIGTIHGEETLEIQGVDTVDIAMQGESIVDYQAPEGFVFYLQGDYPGVTISPEGRLCISSKAEERIITLYAKKDDQEITKNVLLQLSWTETVNGAKQFHIPDVEETRKINYMETIMKYFPVQSIQYFLYISLAGIFIAYVFIRKKS